jgi:hypothetical protein
MTEISNIKKELSNRWSLSNFLYLKEGAKSKLNTKSLQITFAVISLAVLIYQLFAPTKSIEVTATKIFGVPTEQSISTLEEPPVHKETLRSRSEGQRRSSVPVVERIKSISFSRKDGIPTGSEVQAQLSSGGSNGVVKARLSEDLSVNGEVVAEKGSILYGKGNSSENRLYVSFTKLIRTDKTELKVKAQAFDFKDRIVGLKGAKMGNYAFKIAASSALFFISGMAEGLQEQSNSYLPQQKSSRDAALQGVSQATVEQGREMVNNMNNNNVIEVKHSTPILVIFDDGESNE